MIFLRRTVWVWFLIGLIPTVVNAQCEFTIAPSSEALGCLSTLEDVVYTDVVNCSVTGNNIIKTGGGSNWNGGFASTASVYNNGFVETIAAETDKRRMVGLSTTNQNDGFNRIRYAIYLNAGSDLRIYENGNDRGDFGSYTAGDVLKIAIEKGIVRYYKNDDLLYVSSLVPSLPLIVDGSIRDENGTIQNLKIGNLSDGNFSAIVGGSGEGTGAVYQWKLNGSNVGTNSSTYDGPAIAVGDIILCDLIPGAGGCSASQVTSNQIEIELRSVFNFGEYLIEGTASPTACNTVDEEVVWKLTDLNNLEADGNDLNKIQSDGNWDGGAASWNTVSDNGYLEFQAVETDKRRMIGLSTTNQNDGFNRIRYAIYLNAGSDLRIYENGNDRGDFGSYSSGDIFKVAVEAGVVKYFQNDNLLYISTLTPTLPLLADVSIRDINGTVSNAIISNYNTGTFSASAIDAGANPSYQWKLNGLDVGTDSDTYTNTSLVNDDDITCILTPDLSGCTSVTYTSNTITNKVVTTNTSIDFAIQGTVAPTACNTVDEEVVWKLTDLNNLEADGNDLNKIQSDGNWDGGAASWNTVSDNGYLEFQAVETDKRRMIGLSTTNQNDGFNRIRYAIYLNAGSDLRIYENGNDRGDFGSYSSGDIFKVAVEAGVVKYFQNDNLLYISTLTPTLPLLADVSIRDINGTVSNAIVSNYNTGTFSASAIDAGANPSYQWKLNGLDVGTDSDTYTNTSLVNDDDITCILTPDLSGCTSVTYTSNTITNKVVTTNTSIDFAIQGTVAPTACNTVDEEVVWKLTDLNNLEADGNDLNKIQSDGNWDGGAASWNTVSDNGYLEFQAVETDKRRMIGLSTTNQNDGFNRIRYAIYLNAGSDLRIYENGNDRGDFGSYSNGDIFKVAVEAGVVKYFQNDNLLYISTLTPTLPLLADVSIRDINGTVSNAIISNYNTGTFSASAIDAGANPSYQWKLNGLDVGTDSDTYTNTSLVNDDDITCILTPDLSGCTSVTYTSNTITNKVVTTNTSIDFAIQGTVAPTACNTVDEEVVWKLTDLNNLEADGNDLNKIQSDGNWDGGAASWNTVSDNGYLEFQAVETDKRRMIGLSTTNQNDGFNRIRYAIYLNAGSDLRIYENGNDRGDFGSYSNGDIFKVAVEAGVVKYFQNDNLLYISTLTPTLPLLADVSIRDINGTVSNAIISNYNTGTFSASAIDAGANPSYQWKLNGLDVGTDSDTYTNTSLVNDDDITCILTPDLSGCTSVTYTSNTITNKVVTTNTSIDFAIQGTVAPTACNTVDEEVVWKLTDLNNLEADGNDLNKIQSDGNWDGGAASWNTVSDNGYLEFQAVETDKRRMIGLSTTNQNDGFNRIRYAIYLNAGSDLRIYENGNDRGDFGSYSSGDILKVAVEAGVVKYFQNDNLLYISTLTPTLPLLADVSIRDINGTISNAIISNPNNGDYNAYHLNAGDNPSFQWKVNGIDVGTNNSNYNNPNLNSNDIITCLLIPDISGCGVTSYTSNAITYFDPGTPNTWTGATDSDWLTASNWSDGVPGLYSSVTIPTGQSVVLSGLGEVYDITIESGASLSITGANTLNIYRNFTNNGSFIANTSTVNFVSCIQQGKLNGAGTTTFYDIRLNTDVSVEIQSGTFQIANSATWNSGIVYQNAGFVFLDGSTSTLASNESHVEGPVSKVGSTAFEFPIGSNDIWAPLTITGLSGSDIYTAQYVNEMFSDTTVKVGDPLAYISQIEYWELDRTGTSQANVPLHWKDRTRSAINDDADLVIAHFDGSDWESLDKDAINYGDIGSITVNGVSDFSPFTFGSLTPNVSINPLPIELVSFEASEVNGEVLLKWETASEINNDYFTIFRSSDGMNWESIDEISGAGNSNITQRYTYLDQYPFPGRNYYRLKQTDFDGQYELFDAILINVAFPNSRFRVYPNPSEGVFIVEGNGIAYEQILLRDHTGRILKIDVSTNSANSIQIDIRAFSDGIYFLQIMGVVHKLVKD
jgi:predicted aminopeptidase